jgi:hypothetical protein
MVHASPAPAAPLWLSRERDVISHLFYAAAEIGGAVVELGGQPFEGVLAMPDPKAGTFAFFLAEGQGPRAAPAPGAVVRVSYLQGEAAYAFLTVIAETDGHRRWELRFPASVERSERRHAAVARHPAGRAIDEGEHLVRRHHGLLSPPRHLGARSDLRSDLRQA